MFNGNQAILTCYSSCSSGLFNDLGWSCFSGHKVRSINPDSKGLQDQPVTNVLCSIPKWMMEATTKQMQTHFLPSVLGGSVAELGSGVSESLGGGCVWIGVGSGGGGVYLKALRLFITWFPTNVLRPNALQSTTVMVSGGWRCSFSGSS